MSNQTMQQPGNKPINNPLVNYFRQPKLYVKLPSRGEFYPKDALDISEIDEYAVYAMTAKDELMFKTPDALMNGQATVEVIKSCVPAIKNPWAMPSIDMDAILIAIRIATYGEKMEVRSSCPACNHFNEYEMNLVNYLEEANNFQYESSIQVGELVINIRPYSYQEVSKTQIRTMEQQKILALVNDDTIEDDVKISKFSESFIKLTELTVDVVTGCIASIETPQGIVEDQAMIHEFVQNSPSDVFNKINSHVNKMKEMMTLKTQEVKCNECGHGWQIEVTMDQTNFFIVGS